MRAWTIALLSSLAITLLCSSFADAEDAGPAPEQDAGAPRVDSGVLDDTVLHDAGVAIDDAGVEPAAMLGPLPPATPTPDIAPIVSGTDAVHTPPKPVPSEQRPTMALKALLGLLLLLSFAYVAGHPRVQALERRWGVSQVITAGFPFVILGLVARTSVVGVLTDDLLARLSPLLRIGLGCIGFVTGFRFSALLRAEATTSLVRAATYATVIPFATVAALSGALLLWLSGEAPADAFRDPVFIRDALILGTAGAMTARSSADLFRGEDTDRGLARLFRLEELAGIAGLAIVAAYFRPSVDVTWQLPGTAWLLMTLGVGIAVGGLAYAIFRASRAGPELVVLTLGVIAFCAGMAGYLRLSPVVVAFLAASCLAVLPTDRREPIRVALRRLERPVYFLSLIVIGALWQFDDVLGWILVPVFTAARLGGKWLSSRLVMRHADLGIRPEERHLLATSPMGPLAIAIVVNAQLLYPGGSIAPIVGAVLGGAILTEIVVQIAGRKLAAASAERGRSGPVRTVDYSDPPERTS